MSEKLKAPKLRFPGFTDAWEQRKLVNCFKERTERCAEGELIAVTINSGVVKASDLNRNNNSSEDKSHYKVVKKNDIAYNTMRMWQGASGYSKYDGILSPAYTVAIPNSEIDSVFFSYMFKRNDLIHEFKINSQGLTSDTWNLKFQMFSNIKVNVPIYEEQKKIGLFFSEIDNHITLQQRKLETFKKLKKGFLQKMFPKNGESVPEIRFPGFTAAWEQRELGEVSKITMGQSPNGNTYSETPSEYILIQGNADLKDGWAVPRVWTTQMTKRADAGDLIMSVRAPAGAMGKTAYDAVIGRGVAAIKGNEFIYQTLIKMDSNGYWKKLAAGSTFESLNSNSITQAKILIPSNDEQNKIGDFFSKIDNIITLQQRKLESLKKIKQGLLQQMFI